MPPKAKTAPSRRKKAAPRWPSDPLERCHQRWVHLFFGALEVIGRRDRAILDRLLLSLETSGLAGWRGDALVLRPEALDQNPSDKILENASSFYREPRTPPLRGRRKQGRLRPPFLLVLMTYYRYLHSERLKGPLRNLRGQASASTRALAGCGKS